MGAEASGGSPEAPLTTALLYLGIFAPAFAALILTARRGSEGAVGELLSRLVAWDVGSRWYAVAVGYIVAVKLIAAGVFWLIRGSWPAYGSQPILLLLAATVGSTLVGGQVGEELGWRGYALPRMARRWGLGAARLVLGVIWAVWHVPLFHMPGADTYGQSFPLYLIQVTGLSVAVAWLYDKVRGSLLVVMLFHASVNNMASIVPGVARLPENPWLPHAPLLGWVTAGVIWMAALAMLVEMRRPSRPGGSVTRGPPLPAARDS